MTHVIHTTKKGECRYVLGVYVDQATWERLQGHIGRFENEARGLKFNVSMFIREAIKDKLARDDR